MRKKKKRRPKARFAVFIFIILVLGGLAAYYYLRPKTASTAADFNIKIIKSDIDKDGDGIDDYTDILLGAREYVETKPEYISAYYDGGYPPNGIGVCTDVIWKAFEKAGYSLKDMLDKDIAQNQKDYTKITSPDPNIDFRRVYNLEVFFKKYAASLTLDTSKIEEWQPGDIVIYQESHIAIVSDKRNNSGLPYIIHNGGKKDFEADSLLNDKIIGHYRWEGIDNQ